MPLGAWLCLLVTCGSLWISIPWILAGTKRLAAAAGFKFRSHACVLFGTFLSILVPVDSGSPNSSTTFPRAPSYYSNSQRQLLSHSRIVQQSVLFHSVTHPSKAQEVFPLGTRPPEWHKSVHLFQFKRVSWRTSEKTSLLIAFPCVTALKEGMAALFTRKGQKLSSVTRTSMCNEGSVDLLGTLE